MHDAFGVNRGFIIIHKSRYRYIFLNVIICILWLKTSFIHHSVNIQGDGQNRLKICVNASDAIGFCLAKKEK